MAVNQSQLPSGGGGFTLLELIIATAIFALVSAMAYGSLNSIMKTNAIMEAKALRLNKLQMAVLLIGRDLKQTVARQIRNEYGEKKGPLLGVEYGQYRLELTRTGWRNPIQQPRSNFQRVAYGLHDEQLIRYAWSVLDRAQDVRPIPITLLDGVKALELRYLDEQQTWKTSWPETQFGEDNPAALPIAIEFTIDTIQEGKITRLYQLAAGLL